MRFLRVITVILGCGIAFLAGVIAKTHETTGGFVAVGGGLWLGAVAGTLEDNLTSVGTIAKSFAASIMGLIVFVLGFGIIFSIFGAILYLLDNPITKNLTYMPGILAEVVSPLLIPVVLVPLFWLAMRSMKLLTREEDSWLWGWDGAIKAPLALLPIGLLGIGLYLLLTNVFGISIGPTVGLIYLTVFGGIYGWAVPGAIHFME